MENDPQWETNAMLRDGESLLPCNSQDAETESGHYVWALPLAEVPRKPRTSLLAELLNMTDATTSLPVVQWCEWQPCLCDELGSLLEGHFSFLEDDTGDDCNGASDDERIEASYTLMIDAADRDGIMVGQWDGSRRDQETGLPIVHVFAFPMDSSNS